MIKFWLAKQIAELIPYLILFVVIVGLGLWHTRKRK